MSAVTTVSSLAAVVASVLAALLLVPGKSPPVLLSVATREPDDPAAGSDPPVLQTLVTVSVGLGVAMLVGGLLGLALAPLAAAPAWWLAGRLEPPAARRRRERLESAVPHAVDLMAACLAAGLSPAASVEQVRDVVDEPLARELAGLARRLELGVDPATVWRELAGHPQLGSLGRTMSRAVESGASVAEAMQRLADDLRGRSRARVESRARAVGVKAAVPLGGCLLPAFVLVGVVPLVAGSVTFLLR
jgi:Flp pilus assembly protein TadB